MKTFLSFALVFILALGCAAQTTTAPGRAIMQTPVWGNSGYVLVSQGTNQFPVYMSVADAAGISYTNSLASTDLVYSLALNNSNFTKAVGLNLTNLTATTSNTLQSLAYQIGLEATNYTKALGTSLTNYALAIGLNATNYANAVGLNLTNLTATSSNALRTLAYLMGTQSTNYSLALGVNVTNFTKGVGTALTNLNTASSNALQSAIDGKEPAITDGTSLQYWRGDKTWQAIDDLTNGLASIARVTDATNTLFGALGTAAFKATSFFQATNTVLTDFIGLGTNWAYPRSNPSAYVTASVTNGLASTNYADARTKDNLVPGSNITFTTNGNRITIASTATGGDGGLTTAILTLNALSGTNQSFATGTSGTDFAISSSGTTHTFNLPTASAANRGLLSTTDWSAFNGKAETSVTNGFARTNMVNSLSNALGTIAFSNSVQFVGTNAFIPFTNLLGTAAFLNGNEFQPTSQNLTNWGTFLTNAFYHTNRNLQAGSANLTNWSTFSTNAFYHTNNNLQAGSVNLTNWSALLTNWFYNTNANLQAGSIALSNFVTLGTNWFYPTNRNLQAGSTVLSNFVTLGTNWFYPTNRNLQAGSINLSNYSSITTNTFANAAVFADYTNNLNAIFLQTQAGNGTNLTIVSNLVVTNASQSVTFTANKISFKSPFGTHYMTNVASSGTLRFTGSMLLDQSLEVYDTITSDQGAFRTGGAGEIFGTDIQIDGPGRFTGAASAADPVLTNELTTKYWVTNFVAQNVVGGSTNFSAITVTNQITLTNGWKIYVGQGFSGPSIIFTNSTSGNGFAIGTNGVFSTAHGNFSIDSIGSLYASGLDIVGAASFDTGLVFTDGSGNLNMASLGFLSFGESGEASVHYDVADNALEINLPVRAGGLTLTGGGSITSPDGGGVDVTYAKLLDITNDKIVAQNADGYLTNTTVSISAFETLAAGPAYVQTNFVINTIYSNGSGRLQQIRANAALTTAPVAGQTSLKLMMDPTGGTSYVPIGNAGTGTTLSSLSLVYTNEIAAFIPSGAAYYFTNTSTGAGNSSALVTGTGQRITY